MAMPHVSKTYALKDKTERIVDNFAILENPTQADLNRVKTEAQVQFGIERYRAGAADIDEIELEAEKHNSARLARHLEEACDPRPNKYCHAHAIVAGKHPEAVKLRAVLAWRKMRIDDSHNGCWLPENTAAKAHMPARLSNAVPHSRIHRFNYYFWLNSRITLVSASTFEELAGILSRVQNALQSSAFPDYVMKPKGEGLPI
ncbi:MAG: AHH domain-containing protein [Pseudomonadota bacterium]